MAEGRALHLHLKGGCKGRRRVVYRALEARRGLCEIWPTIHQLLAVRAVYNCYAAYLRPRF